MSNEEIESAIKELLKDSEIVTVNSVQDVNHKPHPYCITEKHITGNFASLDSDTIRELEKQNGPMYVKGDHQYTNGYKAGYERCNLPYDQHTSDKVLFLSLKQHTTGKEVQSELHEVSTVMIANNVDGLAFVETEEEFRITD